MVQEWKIKETEKIKKAILDHAVVGMVDLNKLPAAQLHAIRKELRDIAEIKITKKCVLTRAIDGSKKENIDKLNSIETKNPGIILSNENPFRLFSKINKSKVLTYLKPGDKAPKDIIIPAGDTKLTPGPIIGELQKAKIKAKIQGPIITITADSKVADEGDEITSELASILMQLGIKPILIGINMVAAHENGAVFLKDMLDIKEDEYISNIQDAYRSAFNLAFNSAYPASGVISHLIGKAHRDSLNLAMNANVVNSETIKTLIQKASSHMQSVASKLPDDAKGDIKIEESKPVAAPVAEAGEVKKEKKEDKEEEKKPEEAAAGLGALFG